MITPDKVKVLSQLLEQYYRQEIPKSLVLDRFLVRYSTPADLNVLVMLAGALGYKRGWAAYRYHDLTLTHPVQPATFHAAENSPFYDFGRSLAQEASRRVSQGNDPFEEFLRQSRERTTEQGDHNPPNFRTATIPRTAPSPIPPYLRSAAAALGLSHWPITLSEVKTAYRQQARQSHPDAGGSAEAFLRVQSAYEKLKEALA